jgi:hypothetical protein
LLSVRIEEPLRSCVTDGKSGQDKQTYQIDVAGRWSVVGGNAKQGDDGAGILAAGYGREQTPVNATV